MFDLSMQTLLYKHLHGCDLILYYAAIYLKFQDYFQAQIVVAAVTF